MHSLRIMVVGIALIVAASVEANTGAIPVIGKGHTAAVVHNGEMYVFYKSSSTCQVGYVKTSDGVNWSAEQYVPLPFHCIGNGPHSAVSFNSKIYLFVDDGNNPGAMWYTSLSNGTWAAQKQVDSTSGLTDATVYNGQLHYFWREASGLWVRHRTMNTSEVWSSPIRWSEDEASYGVAAAPFNSRLYQAWTGFDGTYKKMWAAYKENGVWAGRHHVNSGDYPLTSVAPDVTQHNLKFYIVYVGSYDSTKLYYKALNTSYQWENEVEWSTGGAYAHFRPAVVSFNNQLWVFYKLGHANTLSQVFYKIHYI